MSVQPVLMLACGAIAHEIVALKKLNNWHHMELQCLDAELHNRPKLIAGKLQKKIDEQRGLYQHIFIGYGDCGSGGDIDRLIIAEQQRGTSIERLPGAHCYQFFAGMQQFEDIAEKELGSFYLTDFLVAHFERIIIKSFKLDKHPQLKDMLFNNYTKLVYLSQIEEPQHLAELLEAAQKAAQFLQLPFEHIQTGYGELQPFLEQRLNIH